MTDDLTPSWVRTGGICGILAVAFFAVMQAVPLPLAVSTALAASFGPLLSIACVGLYHLLKAERRAVSLQIAAASAALAGALITAMLLVQVAMRTDGHAQIAGDVWLKLRRVDLGLDVAWDVYIVVATVLFSLGMLRHPRFGRVLGGIGLLLGMGLGVLNMVTFPTPPANANLVDLGPFCALWYLVVSVQMLRSVAWARAKGAVGPPVALG
jgi:hypothetical protein